MIVVAGATGMWAPSSSPVIRPFPEPKNFDARLGGSVGPVRPVVR